MINLKVYCDELERALLLINQEKAEEVVTEASQHGTPIEIASELISDTLKRIGDNWELGKLSLSQVYMSGVISEKLIDKILPPSSEYRRNQPKIAIGVFEDYHLLGKRIVYSTLRASGFELIDLGGGLSIDKIVSLVQSEKIKILLLSVLMLPSALRLKELKEKLEGEDVVLIVGGAPFRFDDDLCKEVGADYYGKDSGEAIQIISKLMEKSA